MDSETPQIYNPLMSHPSSRRETALDQETANTGATLPQLTPTFGVPHTPSVGFSYIPAVHGEGGTVADPQLYVVSNDPAQTYGGMELMYQCGSTSNDADSTSQALKTDSLYLQTPPSTHVSLVWALPGRVPRTPRVLPATQASSLGDLPRAHPRPDRAKPSLR